jgi:acetoin utilization protein AcuC
MAASVHVAWDESLLGYDFGPSHPMAPVRVDLTIRLARELGVLAARDVQVVAPPQASDDELARVHEPDYVAAVRRVSDNPSVPDLAHGLGTDDNPVFRGMHEATARVVGGTVACAEAVWSGEATHAVNICGGLHHGMPAAASGFCVYNDVAVGIARLLDAGAQRVAYVDVDVHHGDGVERIFWEDPRVLTISLHETGRVLFPGTGWPTDIGAGKGEGYAVNVALPPGIGDDRWLRAFDAVVPPLLEHFDPEVLVTQHGCDSHFLDPLAHMALSVDAQRTSYEMLHDLAHRYAGGRWVATGGGGYEVVDVVPRAWTHLLAIAAHVPLDPKAETPVGWRDYVAERLGRIGPRHLGDGRDGSFAPWSGGYDPADSVDRAVMATRTAVFPHHGLDPHH